MKPDHLNPDPKSRLLECPIAMQLPQPEIYTVPQFHKDILEAKTKKDLREIIRRMGSQFGYWNNFGPENWARVFEDQKH